MGRGLLRCDPERTASRRRSAGVRTSATGLAPPYRAPRARRGPPAHLFAALVALASSPGCMVGPDYHRPPAPLAAQWTASRSEHLATSVEAPTRWWQAFNDPVLPTLVDAAYRQNLSLQAAGLRVIQAQARRGIAIGRLFPQTQQFGASYQRTHSSSSQVASQGVGDFNTYSAGFDAAWELDFWGRFRRGIEAADGDLLASVANYDDVLVSLIGEVAATYVRIRVLEEQLTLARSNARIQSESLEVARARFEAGGTSELDVQQATALLEDTEADIPEFETQLRQAQNSLAVLLGLPPTDLADVLGSASGIPLPPPTVMVAIPAKLLERRPDVRRAESQLAAQSARIGVAKSDLYPRIELTGSAGLTSDQAAKFFEGRSFEGIGGPQLTWPVLNYGRIIDAVRVQDAAFQELVAAYANTVLVAQREVEDAIVAYLRGYDKVAHLERSTAAATRAVELSLIQYRGGATAYTAVLTAQQAKIDEDRRLTATRGDVTLAVVALYKALGGGYEIHGVDDFVPEATKAEMRERTWWGDMLDDRVQAADVEAAGSDTAPADDGGFLRWRWWWPTW